MSAERLHDDVSVFMLTEGVSFFRPKSRTIDVTSNVRAPQQRRARKGNKSPPVRNRLHWLSKSVERLRRRSEQLSLPSLKNKRLGTSSASSLLEGEPNSPAAEMELSPETVRAVQKAWISIRKEALHLGIAVFTSIIDQCPEVMDLFYTGAPESRAKGNFAANQEFRFHALRFMEIIDSIVQSLEEDATELQSVIHNLGKLHRKRRQRGFRPYYWTLFEDAVCETFTSKLHFDSDEEKILVLEAWPRIITYLLRGLKKGYYSEDPLRASPQRSSTPIAASLATANEVVERKNSDIAL